MMTTARKGQRTRWQDLTALLNSVESGGIDALSPEEVRRLCSLYRQVSIDLSRARADNDVELGQYLNILAARAHGHVYGVRKLNLWPAVTFLFVGFPRLVRRHWKPVTASLAVFWLTTLASFIGVVRDPELAYSVFDETIVEYENIRLEKQEGEYKGNFTFDVSDSPIMAVIIIANNIKVAAMTYLGGVVLGVPCLLMLMYNGRMLGTLFALFYLHGYFGDAFNLLMCHGVIELTAIAVAGGGGVAMVWSVVSPGDRPRAEALREGALGSLGLLLGASAMLIVAGLIEAFVTPHSTAEVRWTFAGGSAVALVLYFTLAGRSFRRRPALQSS